MSARRKRAADIALDAWQAAGLKESTIKGYRSLWSVWDDWCRSKGIDPLGATHEQFTWFASEQQRWSKQQRAQYSSTLHRPYRRVNKPNPAWVPAMRGDATIALHTRVLNRFESWCKREGVMSLPARPEDVARFIEELAKTQLDWRLESARDAIGRAHIRAGYASPSLDPIVISALKAIEGIPRPATRHGQYHKIEDRRRTHWTEWCLAQGTDPLDATAAQFKQYMEHMSTARSRGTIYGYRQAISRMYEDPSITWNDEITDIILATPLRTTKSQKDNPGRRETEAEIREILEQESRLMGEQGSNLPPETRARIAQAMASADVTERTLRGYVRYVWLPFKRWAALNGISIQTATPQDVSAFLCEWADTKGSDEARKAHNALMHCFRRVRADANPADDTRVRQTMRGLARELPHVRKQATPMGIAELTAIVEHAPVPWHNERADRAELRAAIDSALLLTMYDTMMRGDEASKVTWDDFKKAPDGKGGSLITIPRSKTDQLAEGAVVYVGRVATAAINHLIAVREKLGIAHTKDNRIFRLGPSGISNHIKAACIHAGLGENYSMHSGRVGAAQDLAIDNVSDLRIMAVARWSSPASVARYTSGVAATKNAVAERDKRKRDEQQGRGTRASPYGLQGPNRRTRLGH